MLDAFWYSIVTFSTVGYGDYFPVSILGKAIGVIFIIFGVGFLGIVVGKISDIFSKISEKRRLGLMGTNFENHIAIIGWDTFAEDVTSELIKADKKVAVITDKKDEVDIIYQNFDKENIFVCFSDLAKLSSLDLINIQKASTVYLNYGNDAQKLISILNIKKVYPETQIVVVLEDGGLTDTFRNAGVTYVLSKNDIASKLIASYIFEPMVADFTKDLVSATDNLTDFDIQQYRVGRGNIFIGSDYGEMFRILKNTYNIIAIGLYKGNKKTLIKVPNDEEKIDENDYVVVIANGDTEKIMYDIFRVNEGI